MTATDFTAWLVQHRYSVGEFDGERCPLQMDISSTCHRDVQIAAKKLGDVLLALASQRRQSEAPDAYIKGVRYMLLANYVEQFALSAFGASGGELFLRCLALPNSWAKGLQT